MMTVSVLFQNYYRHVPENPQINLVKLGAGAITEMKVQNKMGIKHMKSAWCFHYFYTGAAEQ